MGRDYYLSWDCGVCALAYVYFSVDRSDALHPVIVEKADVIDLFSDQPDRRKGRVARSSDVDRARRLYRALSCLGFLPVPGTTVLVEIQAQIFRGRNAVMSRAVEQQILFYYSNPSLDLILVSCRAAAKLKIHFRPELARSRFPVGYAGNKRHAVANFRYFIFTMGVVAPFRHIPRAHWDDVADALMQGLARLGA